MKTPREILTEKHKAVAPKLDSIRHQSVGQASLSQRERVGVRENRSKKDHLPPYGEGAAFRFLQLLWHNLFLPSRRIWTSLAAVWIVILAVNFSMRDHSPAAMAKSVSPEMVQTFKQQEQLLTELIGPFDSSAAEPQKSYTPRPSSRRLPEILTA